MKARNDARAKLAAGRPRIGAPPLIETWLRSHPKALKFVKTWLEMRERGETGWSARMVIEELRREHGYPHCSDARNFVEKAQKAMEKR